MPVEIFLLFSRTLTFFTLLAEGIFILVFVRLLSDGGKADKGISHQPIGPAVLVLLLFVLLFAGEYLCGLLVDLNLGFNRLIYRVVVWDLMATLYALLEGIIAVLACKLYFYLRANAYPGMTLMKNTNPRVFYASTIGPLILFFTVGFCCFEYLAVQNALFRRLNPQGILNMAYFYRIVTGWFWTCFEAAVAFILIKIYLLMKPRKGALHAVH